jgi:hypothetical protein
MNLWHVVGLTMPHGGYCMNALVLASDREKGLK